MFFTAPKDDLLRRERLVAMMIFTRPKSSKPSSWFNSSILSYREIRHGILDRDSEIVLILFASAYNVYTYIYVCIYIYTYIDIIIY